MQISKCSCLRLGSVGSPDGLTRIRSEAEVVVGHRGRRRRLCWDEGQPRPGSERRSLAVSGCSPGGIAGCGVQGAEPRRSVRWAGATAKSGLPELKCRVKASRISIEIRAPLPGSVADVESVDGVAAEEEVLVGEDYREGGDYPGPIGPRPPLHGVRDGIHGPGRGCRPRKV